MSDELCAPRRTDLAGTLISYSRAMALPWRIGSKVGRTIYATDGGVDRLVAVADTPRLADHIVRCHNAALKAEGPPR